jgi:hypothetical protein
MDLYKKLLKRIDNDFGYDNEKLAKDLETIANEHQSLQLQQTGVITSVCDCKPTEYYIDEIRYFKCRFCGKVMK